MIGELIMITELVTQLACLDFVAYNFIAFNLQYVPFDVYIGVRNLNLKLNLKRKIRYIVEKFLSESVSTAQNDEFILNVSRTE